MQSVRSAHRPPPPAWGGNVSRRAGGRRRRAPLRPAREGGAWADLLLALAAAALAAGALILAATFTGENILGGAAGLFWARVFGVALALTGLFLILLALALHGARAPRPGRYAVPVAAGVGAGVLMGALLLDGASREATVAPLLLILLALPPVRHGLALLAGRRAGGGGGRQ